MIFYIFLWILNFDISFFQKFIWSRFVCQEAPTTLDILRALLNFRIKELWRRDKLLNDKLLKDKLRKDKLLKRQTPERQPTERQTPDETKF